MNSTRSAGTSFARLLRLGIVAGIAVTAVVGFSGCTNASGGTNELIGPVIVDLESIDGTQVNVSIDNVVDLNSGSTDVTAWTGKVADPAIAEFEPGRKDGSAEFNPGIQPLKQGTTKVTVTNTSDKSSSTFTLVVTD